MAKRKAPRRAQSTKPARKGPAARRSTKRPTAKKPVRSQARPKKKPPKSITRKKAIPARKAKLPGKVPRLDRARRVLDEDETVQSPPSSLDMDRHGSAARTGRAEMAQSIREHHGMDDVTGGDPDVNIEDAYFAGEEAPGGDNPTPDQDIVEDIGKALGVTYEDNEELKGSDKVIERDKHRWELDPASAEDYKERK